MSIAIGKPESERFRTENKWWPDMDFFHWHVVVLLGIIAIAGIIGGMVN